MGLCTAYAYAILSHAFGTTLPYNESNAWYMLCCAGIRCVLQNKQTLDQRVPQLEKLHSRDLPNARQVSGCHNGAQPVGNMLRLHSCCCDRLWLPSRLACCGTPPPPPPPMRVLCLKSFNDGY